jgi:adenylate cyclase
MASDRATILIVDDMPDNLALVSGLLTPDYHVKVAISGAKALQICHPHAPDLILLDIMMPEMDGFEVLRRLRADPATAGIPVIFLTALADARDEERGFALGAVDYITKPISPPTLLARVRSHTALARQTSVLRTLAGKLAHYLPPQLYQSIFEGRQEVAIRAERKMLTVFFSDIKDFTQTTDEMEPEDLTYLINDYFSEMSRIALDHGATIDKFIGDACWCSSATRNRGVRRGMRCNACGWLLRCSAIWRCCSGAGRPTGSTSPSTCASASTPGIAMSATSAVNNAWTTRSSEGR